ncbi:MAG: hypothetical protein ACRC46_03690 [Thermoguttaceae bacterium]
MQTIPRYWAYARTDAGTLVWRSSPDSEADAQHNANDAVKRVDTHEKKGWFDKRPAPSEYPYGVTLREKLLEEIDDSNGELQAFITRNHAGAEVLNARNVMFLDWDTPPKQESKQTLFHAIARWWRQVFSQDRNFAVAELTSDAPYCPASGFWRERYPWAADIPELHAFMSKIDSLLEDWGTWSVRIYKTMAGYRGIVTHTLFDPTATTTLELMRDFNCDPLYIRLCEHQQSFRARLTPKGMRCGLWPEKLTQNFRFYWPMVFTMLGSVGEINRRIWHPPANRAPTWKVRMSKQRDESVQPESEQIEEVIRLYQEEYENAVSLYETASAPFATCRYIGTVGSGFIHPDVGTILSLHDDATRALDEQELPLA